VEDDVIKYDYNVLQEVWLAQKRKNIIFFLFSKNI
jgi:hypothetical protein